MSYILSLSKGKAFAALGHKLDALRDCCYQCGIPRMEFVLADHAIRCTRKLVPVDNSGDNPHIRAELELLTPEMFRSVEGKR